MATDDSRENELTMADAVRVYKWLTVLALVGFLAAFFLPPVVPSGLTNTVVGVWLLATLLAFAHVGIRNSTHGV
ncbi:hypothetical protein [Halococcus hamelinensis]|nr:hypothetical protein [Halococcus hamelinensis]